MCAIFGLIDYGNVFKAKQREAIIKTLATECEIRGTDSAGIAYNTPSNLNIFKRAVPAHKLKIRLPDTANVIMGHTRMATQGSERLNFNNHPFEGEISGEKFALAHNGVLQNDFLLRKNMKLPDTKIETDSYIAVQLLEAENALSFDTIAKMAERVEGSFVFTILDRQNNIYLVKGDNPLAIYHFEKHGFYLYASTEEILMKTLAKLKWTNLEHQKISTICGDILRINRLGEIEKSSFDARNLEFLNYRRIFHDYRSCFEDMEEEFWTEQNETAINQLKNFAANIGVDSIEIDILLEFGYEVEEIEEMLYNPMEFQAVVNEIVCDYDYCCEAW